MSSDRIKQVENEQSLSGNKENYKRGKHPNSKANLKIWKKGESGNPDGRPHKYTGIKKELMEILDSSPSPWGNALSNDTWRREILEGFLYKAREGSLSHVQFLAEIGCFDSKES